MFYSVFTVADSKLYNSFTAGVCSTLSHPSGTFSVYYRRKKRDVFLIFSHVQPCLDDRSEQQSSVLGLLNKYIYIGTFYSLKSGAERFWLENTVFFFFFLPLDNYCQHRLNIVTVSTIFKLVSPADGAHLEKNKTSVDVKVIRGRVSNKRVCSLEDFRVGGNGEWPLGGVIARMILD